MFLVLTAAAAVLLITLLTREACADCVATFCGNSADCHGGCACVIPMGQATGYCAGTR